jgi:multicomponent Na+:H+ antiporter subunit B
MRDRNRPVFNIFILIILLFATFLIYRGLKDEGEGLKVMSSSPEERVSHRYSTKTVTHPENRSVEYGETGYEEGSANVVTSVVVNYRAFDTLLEVIVLFASTAGVILLIQKRARGEYTESSIIVKTAVPLINIFIFVTGAVIILRGHLTPGGGFAGGAIVASGFILTLLAFRKNIKTWPFSLFETLGGLGILAIGILGIYFRSSFLANFLPTGRLGSFLSSGTVLLLYILIGMKVLSEISNISASFISGENEEVK